MSQPRANVGLATAAAVMFVVACFFALLRLGLPTPDDIPDQYVLRDWYDVSSAYDDVVAQTASFDILTLLLSSIPGFVVWLLMVLNQKRVVEHLLKNGVSVNTESGLIVS